MDPESMSAYDGTIAGTVSVTGWSEEYRSHQLLLYPDLNLIYESLDTYQLVSAERLVRHIQTLQYRPAIEDDTSLKNLLGLSQ